MRIIVKLSHSPELWNLKPQLVLFKRFQIWPAAEQFALTYWMLHYNQTYNMHSLILGSNREHSFHFK